MADVDKLVFRIPAVALLASGVGLICVTPVAFAVPGLQVLYVLPLAFAAWVVRLRTTVTPERIVARGPFSSKTVAWDDVKAVKLSEKSWLSVVLADDELVQLPGVRMMHLPALAAVSGGRITVPAVEVREPVAAEEDGEAGEADTAGEAEAAAETPIDGADTDRDRAERP